MARRPAIRLSWDGDQPDVAAVVFEVRLASTGEVVYRGRTDVPAAGNILISQGLLPKTAYQVRGRYEPRSDRPTLWSGWLPVTTPDVRLTDLDVYLPGMIQEITDQVADITEFATSGTREAIERLRQLALDEENEAAANYTDRQVIRTETALQVGVVRAYVSETLLLAIGPDGVITARLNELEATFGNDFANITQLVQTEVSRIDGELTATADLVDTLSAQVGNVSASISIRAQAVASGQAGVSRWVVQVQAGQPGQYVSSALFLEADSNGIGSIGALTDRFYIANPAQPGQTLQPFVFQNNEAVMMAARVGVLKAGRIEALNGKFIMDLATGTMEWWD